MGIPDFQKLDIWEDTHTPNWQSLNHETNTLSENTHSIVLPFLQRPHVKDKLMFSSVCHMLTFNLVGLAIL